jgi:exonuclease SbcC
MAREAHLYIENFCCIEKASIPLLNQRLVLLMGDNQDTKAADNNGAGKSTIFKAMTWCLFGETLDGDRYDEVIRWGQKRAEVSLPFYVGDRLWIPRRWRTKGSPGLSLSYVEVERRERSKDIQEREWEGDTKGIQAKIVELYGQDFRAFCNTKLFGQEDRNRFYSSNDAARKDTLAKICRTDDFRKAEKRLREREAKAARVEVQQLEMRLDSLRARREEWDIENLERRSREWEERLDARIAEAAEEAKVKITKAKEGHLGVADERRKLEEAEQRAIADAAEIERMEKEGLELSAKRDEAHQKTEDLRRRVNEIDLRLSEVADKLGDLEHDVCPVCTSPLTKGVPATYRKKLLAEKQRLTDQVTPMREQIRDAVTVEPNLAKEVTALGRALNEAGEVVEDVNEIRRKLQSLNATAARQVAVFQAEAKAALDRARAYEEESNPYREPLETGKARLQEIDSEIEKVSKGLEEKRVTMAHYEFWVRGFGLQGLPSLVLDEVMPYLNDRTNHHLRVLTDGDITIGYRTQKDLKSSDKRVDEITPLVTIEGVPGVRPSGGQRRKIDIATELALRDVAEVRESGSNSFLGIDELLDGVDAEGRVRVMQLLQRLRKEVGTIIVITQEPQLTEAFTRAFVVTKRGQASTITEVK